MHLPVTSLLEPTKNLALQPPQLSKMQRALGKLAQVAKLHGLTRQKTTGTPRGQEREFGSATVPPKIQ